MEEQYFVFSNNDGDTHISVLTKDELIERLTPDPDEDGCTYYGKQPKLISNPADNNDPNYWGRDILVLKGSVVTAIPSH